MYMKEHIKGAILIYSCHKHKHTRLKEIELPQTAEYIGWKIFYILGNPQINKDYIFGNTIMLKCEDSYIHVAKKVVMGIQFVYNNYEIEEGVLRCGDDLVFNEVSLINFLNMNNKQDYMGVIANNSSTLIGSINNFMPSYYLSHQDDLQNPLHGIPYTITELMQFNKVPKLKYAGGVVVYLSNKSCSILVSHFNDIRWNIFTFNDTYGYPYIIEDIAIGYVLYINNISLNKYPMYVNSIHDFNNQFAVALHTNKYK